MNGDRWTRTWPVLVLNAQLAMLGAATSCLCLYLLVRWQLAGLGWAARLGYRWGRESRTVQFEIRRSGAFIGVGQILGSLCALIPLAAPGCGLGCALRCIGTAAFGVSMGVVTLVCGCGVGAAA